MSIFIVVSNSPPERAREIARALITGRYAACVNIIPKVQSVYTWDGALWEDEESTLLIKVSSERLDRCVEALVELHPYDVPEVISMLIDERGAHLPYLDWVRAQCREP